MKLMDSFFMNPARHKNLIFLFFISNKQFLSNFFWLSDEIFNRADKLAMHHSIESRAPFADYNLRVNTMNKLTKKSFYTKNNKMIVRNIYNNKLYPNVFKKKRGWTAPRDWILDKRLLEIILDIIPNKEIYNIKWNKIRNDL